MANVYLENWIKMSDLDYFTMFIKSWLPFNAWYMKDFYDETSSPTRTTDRDIINYLKNNSNRYRDKIIALLRNDDDESRRFKANISQLHFELQSHTIPNEQERISFSTINLDKNPLLQHVVSFGHYNYKVEFKIQLPRTQKRWICEVITRRTGQTIHRVELFEWSLTALYADIDYRGIPQDKKQYLDGCFHEMNPKKPEIIILNPQRINNAAGTSTIYTAPAGSLIIDEMKNLYFVKDYELISKVIIQMLYELRCKLFHGELDPIASNLGIYESAYQIQKALIKELI